MFSCIPFLRFVPTHLTFLDVLFPSPVMIEIAGRLAGGRKAIMAEATIPGWHPFDAMIDAHCGFPVRMPPSFSLLEDSSADLCPI